ncbi:MAG: metallophosphoesterase [Clostridia bacterium]|nr:metallophosphoesterase [Clostridia bacterium]
MKYILIAIAAFIICPVTAALIEPHWLKVTENSINGNNKSSLKILFFSDLHMSFCFIPAKRITDTIYNQKPDVVIFGGDLINKKSDLCKARDLMQRIKSTCDELNIPFIGVTGNHDKATELSSEDLEECGFKLIDGDSVCINKEGKLYRICGIRDSGKINRVWDMPSEESDIIVVHNPDYALLAPEEAFRNNKLILSGHIHGGQIRTPFKIEFTVLRKDRIAKNYGIYTGLHEVNGKKIFISRGIGCVLLPLRLGARPEVNIINI